MKKWKSLSVLIFGALASIFFVGCSCSSKDVNPTKISVSVSETYTFVDETTKINYTIEPSDSSNTKVEVSVNKENVVELSATSFDSVTGSLTVKGKTVDTEGVLVTFTISGTSLKTSTLVKVMPDPIKLTATSTITYSAVEKAIMFKNVPNTKNYLVNINGTDYPVSDTSTSTVEHYVSLPVFNSDIPLTTNQINVVKVKALGDAMNFVDGDYSSEYKFLKYSPITNLAVSNGVFTWDSHEVAPLYRIKVNGQALSTYSSSNSYTLNYSDAGEYEVQISAANNTTYSDGCYFFDSDFSESYKVTKLATPQLSLTNDNKVQGVITNSLVTFPKVLGASGYKVKVTPALETSGSEFEISTNSLEITEEFVVDTNYTIEILPLGDLATTVSGSSSTITVKRLGSVDNFAISDNVLTFDGISYAGGYEIILSNATETKTVSTTTTSINLAEALSAEGTYQVLVRALGLVTDTLNIANGVTVDTEKTITKLGNVTITAVKNDGTVTWNAVNGTNNYSVYLNGVYVSNTSSTSYTLTATEIPTGANEVQVVAIGDGVTSITSGLQNASVYTFTKLLSVSEFAVANDVFTFTGVTGALNYNVKLNSSAYRLIGSDPSVGYTLLDVVDGVNQIYVVSVGDDVKTISSDVALFNVTRLSAPTNLRTENGIIVWDHTEGLKYKYYVGDDVDGVEVTTNSTVAISVVDQNVTFKVKAIPTEGNYISSAFTTKTIYKLANVTTESIKASVSETSNTLANYKLTWNAVTNATKYQVEISNATEKYNYEPTSAEVVIPEALAVGDYTVKVYAIGSTSTDGVGYVNSNLSQTTVRKLGKPTGLTIRPVDNENYLVWTPATGDTPAGYTLEITYNENTTYVNLGSETGYLFNPEEYNLGDIVVRVRSIGNNVNLITGEYSAPYTITRAEAIENLRIENGVVTWDTPEFSDVTYIVLGTTTPSDSSSYTKLTANVSKNTTSTTAVLEIEEGVQYTIKVVIFATGVLNSEPSTTLKITKLNTVSGFKMTNSVISWNAVTNATGYVVGDSNNNNKSVTATNIDFSDFGNTLPGNYTFTVYAVGSASETEEGYVNGQKVASGLSVTILASATSATITDNVLIITNTNTVLPVVYLIDFTHSTEGYITSVELEGTTFDLSVLDIPAGQYKIEIYSLGNNEDIISNLFSPLTLDGITKINEENLGLRVFGGEINWTADVNKKFDVYLNGEKIATDLQTNTITITTLEKGVAYQVQIVAKQNGQISSNLSPVLTVTKLPDITGFKIAQTVVNTSTGESDYTFTWDTWTESSYDTSKFNFEVIPVTPLEPFNGGVPGNANTYAFSYADTVKGEFKFNIKAIGTVSDATSGYLNGDTLESDLNITILDRLVFTSYNRETNTINFTNTNTNASAIQIAYYNTVTGKFDYTEKINGDATSYIISYASSLEASIYDIYFNCLGDVNNGILMHNSISKLTIELLNPVTNVRTENGYFAWTHDGGEGISYQIYLDDKLVTYTVTTPAEEEGADPIVTTVSSFTTIAEARIINSLITDTNPHTLYIKVIKEGAIDSEKSDVMTVQKLGVVSDSNFNEHKYYWSSITNASGYVIRCSNATMSTLFGSEYNETYDGIFYNSINDGLDGKTLPLTMPAGSYGFYVVAVGNTVGCDELGFLTGSDGNIAGVSVLSNTANIYVNNGIVCWDAVSGAAMYYVDVATGQEFDYNNIERYDATLQTKYSLEDTFFADEWHVVRITAIGDGSTTLTCSVEDIKELIVYKSPSPDTYTYKVRDGFISWEVPIDDGYIAMVTEGLDYDNDLIWAAAQGQDGEISEILKNNLAHFRNLEVTINNKVYTNQKPYSIELSGSNLIYKYDFNFTNIVNPYSVSVRFIGGSNVSSSEGSPDETLPADNSDIIESKLKTSYNVKVLSDEGSDIPEEETPMVEETAYNVVSSNYSGVITGYKLPAPQSPVVEIKTMVANDSLYFAQVDAGDFDVRYLITATCADITKQKVEFIIDSDNIDDFIATGDDSISSGSGSVLKVPISAIKESSSVYIEEGFVYSLNVRALGTKDSGSATTGVYFTGLYDQTCEVERLQAPVVFVSNGLITFANVASAIKQELRIWSTGIGSVYDRDAADKDKSDDLYAEQITITEDEVTNNPFLALTDLGYTYSLIDNPLFPAGCYYATCEAVGNGITKISSKQAPTNAYGEAETQLLKLDTITALKLNGGRFSWTTTTYEVGGKTYYAENYTITIIRRLVGSTEEELFTEIIPANYVQSGSDCFYDLNSLDYPAVDKDGNRYEYALKVSACGTLDSTTSESRAIITLSGDSQQTNGFYKRLLAPQNVEMVNGTLRWLNVDQATKYEVYKLDVNLTEEELPSYGIVTDDNYRQLTFSADAFTSGQVFSLRIRAIPGSLTETYLNGEFTPEILCKKLETPDLRVVNGIVKWNNTDLSYSIATGTTITISKLESADATSGTVIYSEANLKITESLNTDAGLDLYELAEKLGITIEPGYYKVEVGYIGSNGEVTTVVSGDASSALLLADDGSDDPASDGSDSSDSSTGDGADDGASDDTGSTDDGTDSGDDSTDDGTGDDSGSDDGTDDEPDVPVVTEKYSWFSSNIVSMVVYKLETPVADLYIEEDLENPANYISVEIIENALYYQFTVYKQISSTYTKSYTFDKVNIEGLVSETYYKRITDNGKDYLLFNLQAVADEDSKIPDQANPFGQEYLVYVRAFNQDSTYTTSTSKYAISDRSNSVAVEVPVTPTNLTVNTATGLISWVNKSNTTKTQIKIYYNDSADPVIYTVDAGVSTYKLTTIGKFEVSVLSYITTSNGIEVRSGYSDPVEGNFIIFASGSGTVTDPYILSESSHMLNIDYYLDAYYEFSNSIEMNNSDLEQLGGFMIGRDGGVFNGTIDGKGYNLTNVHLAYSASEIALIDEIGSSGVVKNLNIGIKTGSSVYYTEVFAGLAITNRGTISNVTTIAPISGSTDSDGTIKYNTMNNQSISGFVYENYGTITNATNNMTIIYNGTASSSMNTMVAGIVNSNYGTVTMSANTGTLKGTIVGGIAYSNLATITLSYNTGAIHAVAVGSGKQALAGGIAARNVAFSSYKGTITYCYSIISAIEANSSSSLAADKAYAGGIVADNGLNTGNLVGCYVVMQNTASINNGVFGVIVGMDDSKDSSKYSGNYYISGVAVNEMGNDSSCDIAEQVTSANNLSSALVQAHSTVYVADTKTINSGYPVFIWQSENA